MFVSNISLKQLVRVVFDPNINSKCEKITDPMNCTNTQPYAHVGLYHVGDICNKTNYFN